MKEIKRIENFLKNALKALLKNLLCDVIIQTIAEKNPIRNSAVSFSTCRGTGPCEVSHAEIYVG